MLFHSQEKGQGLVEYAIILVFVAIVVIAIMRWLGPKVGNIFSTINSSL
jgi:pilus assembly protein Flp/PilA